MQDKATYPYRDTIGDREQQPSPNRYQTPYQQQQQPYPAGMRQGGYPQTVQPIGTYAMMGTHQHTGNTMAILALVAGIISTIISLGAYLLPNASFFITQIILSSISIALGIFGIIRSQKLGGLNFGHGLTGMFLGGFSVIIFCTLASMQIGSLSNMFNSDAETPSVVTRGGTEQPSDLKSLFSENIWTGVVLIPDGAKKGEYVAVAFKADCPDGGDGAFEWSERFDAASPRLDIDGSVSVAFGDDAMKRAQSDGFTLDMFGGESFASWVSDTADVDLVYMELEATSPDSLILGGGTRLAWFGYIDCQYGTPTLNVCRLSDASPQLFHAA